MTGPTPFTTVLDLAEGPHTRAVRVVPRGGERHGAAVVGGGVDRDPRPERDAAPGATRSSADGHYWIGYQGDNNLVVRRPNGEVAWASGTTGAGVPLSVAMQLDGNLVMYAEAWQPVWSTATAGHPGAWLRSRTTS